MSSLTCNEWMQIKRGVGRGTIVGYYLSDIRLSRLKYPTIPCVFRIERDGNYHVAGEGNLLQSFSMPLGSVYLPVQVKNLKQSKSLSVGEWVKKWI